MAGVNFQGMHGMLSAGVLVAVFAAIAAAGLYVAVRVFRAGGRRRRAGATS